MYECMYGCISRYNMSPRVAVISGDVNPRNEPHHRSVTQPGGVVTQEVEVDAYQRKFINFLKIKINMGKQSTNYSYLPIFSPK